jgi:alcohol dehydrogenase (cytochrome c)
MRALCFAFLITAAAAAQVPYKRIAGASAEPGSWLTYNGTYDAQRFSRLDQIRTDNVARLKLSWMYQLRTPHKVETTPLVVDGIMYITEPPSNVTALDVKTGRPIWKYQRKTQPVAVCCGEVNRGLAALDDMLFLGTIDAHLVALDMKTGRVRWDIEVADHKLAYSITLAPLAVKDKIIIGVAGAEYGVRGFLDAYHASTGERAWRFWTTPGPGEPGHETWSGDSWKIGGATTWMTGAYDPQANLVYWGTGNPSPDYIGDVRKGDNLYSDSVIALDADSGKLKWHFQFVPHDVNDMDANQIPILLDGNFRGRPRKLMLFANRNGFYYVLDRLTGEFLMARQFARQNWALSIDERGRPVPNPKTTPNLEGALVYPDDDGAANWHSPSYSPQTGLFYQNVRERGAVYYRTEATFEPGKFYLGAARRPIPGEPGSGALRAWDALTGERRWEFPYHTPPWSGILTTAGGLLFSATMEGDFFALEALTGKLLWRMQTGGPVWAAPIAYLHAGKQFVAIASGAAIMIFGLD